MIQYDTTTIRNCEYPCVDFNGINITLGVCGVHPSVLSSKPCFFLQKNVCGIKKLGQINQTQCQIRDDFECLEVFLGEVQNIDHLEENYHQKEVKKKRMIQVRIQITSLSLSKI